MTLASRFALLFTAQFFAVGVIMPFFPAVLAAHGLSAQQVGALLAAGSAVRLFAGPLGGRLADALGDTRRVLAVAAGLAALTAGGLLAGAAFWGLLLVILLHSAAIAPIVPLTDALATTASRGTPGFDYARVRAAGSIAFTLAALAAGWAVAAVGTQAAVWLLAGGLAATAVAALGLPSRAAERRTPAPGLSGLLAPLRIRAVRRLLVVSGLMQGSHAMFYAFGTLHWQAAGLDARVIGGLWAAGVLAEVALFLWGRRFVARLGPVGLSLAAAGAGAVRWSILAVTTDPWLLLPAQLLHAATFGMQHLATIAVLGRVVPPALAGTAQTLHAALGVGLWMGLITLASGPAYAAFGGSAFWAMAGLCALAVPASLRLAAALRKITATSP